MLLKLDVKLFKKNYRNAVANVNHNVHIILRIIKLKNKVQEICRKQLFIFQFHSHPLGSFNIKGNIILGNAISTKAICRIIKLLLCLYKLVEYINCD